MLDIIFPKFSFSKKLWFCPDIFSRFLFGQPFQIFVVLNFSRESRFQKCLLLFYPRFNVLLIPSSAKAPGWKISGSFQSWESNRGQQWLSRTDQIKICQGFSFKLYFAWFLRENIGHFWSHIQWRGQPVGKNGNRASLIDRSRW